MTTECDSDARWASTEKNDNSKNDRAVDSTTTAHFLIFLESAIVSVRSFSRVCLVWGNGYRGTGKENHIHMHL